MARALIWRLGAAAVGGTVGSQLPSPLGTLLGALVAAVSVNVRVGRGAGAPAGLRLLVQVLLGALIGSRLGAALTQPTALLPGLAVSAVAIVTWVVGSLAVARIAGVDLPTALLASAPSSPSEMTAAATEAGLRADLIAALQLGRVLLVLLLAGLIGRVM
jgi:uncharacterized protein